ncbi:MULTISPECIES: YisL family protein [Nosocomiicoccus]|uniref:YisL family protein n=1 Tax=Nosocomiicoccus TaxID=489909 RepID=UPI000834C085|nr:MULTISPECIES: YisL family protein [Nosocomiicoccus]OFL49167.1 hypothetical protein HMPREF2767_06365 [Nosocomiicoccus sp. HMSC067E10]OFO52755.1 hypothetical protein HMPREF3029_02120 [Nosocomiicoccus sp. HMSC059G07]OFS62679.1 hypothetical protein HMPREF3177_05060 [Nosocomiicoccus sp. HMSC09A07]
MLHLHLTAIALAFVLFLITYFSYKGNPTSENRRAFILHMTLRLFYIIVLFSGVMIFIQNLSIIGNVSNGHMMYGLKALLGLGAIALMEMTLVREKKETNVQMLLIIAIVVIIVTVLLGSYLPLGVL